MDERIRETVEKVAEVLRETGAKEVYVFGSAATGKMREGSDLDFAVSGLPPESFFRAVGRALCAADLTVDLVDLDQDNPFTQYLKTRGPLVRVG